MRIAKINGQQTQNNDMVQKVAFKASIIEAKEAIKMPATNSYDSMLKMFAKNIIKGIEELLSDTKLSKQIDLKLGQKNVHLQDPAVVKVVDEYLNIPYEPMSLVELTTPMPAEIRPVNPKSFGEILKVVFEKGNAPNPDKLTLK